MEQPLAVSGIVLRQTDLGEADRIVSLLTEQRGRIEVRVPQARKSRKRFGGLDLYAGIDAELQPGRRAPRLQAAEVCSPRTGLRDDLVALALAGHVAELLLQAAPEEHVVPDLHRLTTVALDALDEAARAGRTDGLGLGWARAFELKLLHVLGTRPALRRCAVSGASIEAGPIAWSVGHGGVLVGEARADDPHARPVGRATLERLDEALRRPLRDQALVAWTPSEEAEARRLMGAFVAEHVGTRSRARRFLDQVLGVAPALAALLVLGAGCVVETDPAVRVQGWLFDTDAPLDDSSPVSGARLEAWDDAGELLGEGGEPFTDSPGFYRVSDLPAEVPLHLSFAPPEDRADLLPTVLSGRSAADDLWVDPGVFHLRWGSELEARVLAWNEAAEAAGRQERWALPDPAADEQGGFVLGVLADPATHAGQRIGLRDGTGLLREAVYADADGEPAFEVGTGPDGSFGAGGLLAGPVEVLLLDAQGIVAAEPFVTRAEEDAVTSLRGYTLP